MTTDHRLMQGLLLALLVLAPASGMAQAAEVRDVQLTIARTTVEFTGRPVQAMAINGTIPGPTLRFTEGDIARIHVRNEMEVETSIHWHGLLVPPDMDGVPNLTFPPIAAGATFTYEFPIRQSGTYWYHSHTRLQEQRGVYGSIVITPRAEAIDPGDAADSEHVVLLSDWTDTDPHQVLRTLRRGSEWYAVQRGTGQSILGAARVGRLGDYFARELQRMPAMDIADVAYDVFLANGQRESSVPRSAGRRVRLRLIDGSATTFFHVEFAGGPMTVISADGIDVEPFETQRLLIAVAETYDVLVDVPADGAWELRATSHDASGHASVWLGEGERHPAPTVPHPDLYQGMGGLSARRIFAWTPAGSMGMPDGQVEAGALDAPGMHMEGHGGMAEDAMEHGAAGHGSADHGAMDHGSTDHGAMDHESMDHGAMDHESMDHGATGHEATDDHAMGHEEGDRSPDGTAGAPVPERRGYGRAFGWLETDLASRGSTVMDGMGPERPGPPYARLRARRSTALPADRPVREIRLTLDGDMERYVWFLGGKALSERDDIRVREGEVARFILINRTMMHHPMHLHGHFFRVVNGQGDRSPLKHTVDVEPMSTTVIEFDANEVGDWFFHCHLLYHMKSGMARVVSYEDFVPSPEVQAVRSRLYRDHWYRWGAADLSSNMSSGSLVAADTRNLLTAEWEVGWNGVEDSEGEFTLTWDRYRHRFLSVFVGLETEFSDDQVDDPRGVLGARYLLPFNLESTVRVDTEGDVRLELERVFHLTPRLSLGLEAEFDTLDDAEGRVRASYLLSQRFDLVALWHSEFGVGAGVSVRF